MAEQPSIGTTKASISTTEKDHQNLRIAPEIQENPEIKPLKVTLRNSLLLKISLFLIVLTFQILLPNKKLAPSFLPTVICYSLVSCKLFPRIKTLSNFIVLMLPEHLRKWSSLAYLFLNIVIIVLTDICFAIFYVYIINKIKALTKM